MDAPHWWVLWETVLVLKCWCRYCTQTRVWVIQHLILFSDDNLAWVKCSLRHTTLPHLPAAAAVGFSTCLAAEAAALVTLPLGAGWAAVCNAAREMKPRDKELHSSNNWKFPCCRNQKKAPAVIRCMGLAEWTGLEPLFSAMASWQCTEGSWLELVLLYRPIKAPMYFPLLPEIRVQALPVLQMKFFKVISLPWLFAQLEA